MSEITPNPRPEPAAATEPTREPTREPVDPDEQWQLDECDVDLVRVRDEGWVAKLTLGPQEAMAFVSTVQRACKHPFKGATRDYIEKLARRMGTELSVTPAIKRLVDKGWEGVT